MDRPKTYIDALRVLARTIDSNRVVLIERNIEKAVERAERDLEVAIAARKRLEQNLRELEDDAAECANEVLIEIKLLLFPIAKKLLDETDVLKKRLHMNQRLLDLLTSSEHPNDQPRVRDDMRRMRADERRNAVFTELRSEVQRLTFGSPEDVLNELAVWKAAVAALRTDPAAALPEKL
jgi:DNA repair exonuclease SbcCD ATPase subunit